MKLWEQSDLEAELSAEVVRQVFDDDNSGEADETAITRLQDRSCAYVVSELSLVYPQLIDKVTEWQTDLTQVPVRLKDLSLDYAVAICAKRHASYVRRDWKKLIEHVEQSIARIREKGLASLGTKSSPEPASNQGCTVDDGTGTGIAPVQFFNGCEGLGDF